MPSQPFEPNAFWEVVSAFCRWFGSPIASLSYSLWNIRISGHAALMVDMATPYKQLPGEHTDFADIRDSFYLLMIMNQYTMKTHENKREAEGLLRVAMFAKDLKMRDGKQSLKEIRCDLAQALRENRRGGAVPAFLGQASYCHMHKAGFLSKWLTVVVMVHVRHGLFDSARCVDKVFRDSLIRSVDVHLHSFLGGGQQCDSSQPFHRLITLLDACSSPLLGCRPASRQSYRRNASAECTD